MKSWRTGEVQDLGNVADALTTCTGAQSVKDNSKMTKNNQNVSSEAKDVILTSNARNRNAKHPGRWSPSATKGTTPTHQKTG